MQGPDLSCSLVIPSKLPGETSFSLFTLINGEGGELALGLAMLLRVSLWVYCMSFHGGLWLQEKAMTDPQERGDVCELSLLSFVFLGYLSSWVSTLLKPPPSPIPTSSQFKSVSQRLPR